MKGKTMPRFAITEKAGRLVAGQNNTGVGSVLTLTEKQAEHEVRLGTLLALDVPAAADEGKKAGPGKGKKAAKADPKPAEGGDDQGGDETSEGAGDGEGDQ
jgi:hypothetical protein